MIVEINCPAETLPLILTLLPVIDPVAVIAPVALIFPTTVSFDSGILLPIPTFPVER